MASGEWVVFVVAEAGGDVLMELKHGGAVSSVEIGGGGLSEEIEAVVALYAVVVEEVIIPGLGGIVGVWWVEVDCYLFVGGDVDDCVDG